MIIKKLLATKNILKIGRNRHTVPVKLGNSPDVFSQNIGKQKCINALKCKNPYELVVTIDKSSGKILGEFIGDLQKCHVKLPQETSPLVLLHGHVSVKEKTLPVSLQDFLLMNDTNVNKIIAYNKNGQESYLQKNANFTRLNKNQIEQLKVSYLHHILNNASSEDTAKLKSLIKYCIKNKNSKLVKQEIVEKINDLQFKSDGLVDKFWRKNASKLNLEYFSNFD